MDFPINIAVLGPGLLGGSVALAARASGCAKSVRLWARRAAAVEEINRLQIADLASTDLQQVVDGVDLIILATPVGVMPALVERLLELPDLTGAILTDLGSVKGNVVAAIDARLAGSADIHFVGSHPMAGKEQAGIEHASADLFQGAACVLTPGATSTEIATATVEDFWKALGCRTLRMRPDEHDAAVARISHLPHLAASLVVASALGVDPSFGRIAGAGLRDTTRVASGPPGMWAEILLENSPAIIPALKDLSAKLNEALRLLESGDSDQLEALLRHAKEQRDGLGNHDAD
ncbi:MAG: prephenate dehydrogenase [Verrucomicrobiales bacterium]|jgi:prephenate dehydrogenase